MFTGDRSGDWLYRALHKAGLASQPDATSRDDGLQLHGCAITAVCHCAPPDNRPTREEIDNCRAWLDQTFDFARPRVLLALGQLAWKGVVDQAVRRGWLDGRRPKFGHAVKVPLQGHRWLLGSYHPSQQNTFTGRLTEPMFDRVFERAVALMNE
jgi:uracil-DNA glycosylase family 4